MIVKMKKLTFLVTGKEYEQFLADIRHIGVVHIEELQSGATSPEFDQGRAIADRFKATLNALNFAQETWTTDRAYTAIDPASVTDLLQAGQDIAAAVEALQDEEKKLKHKLEANAKTLELLEPWGDFDQALLDRLDEKGYSAHCFACPTKMFKNEWQEQYYAIPVAENGKKTYFVCFAPQRPDITAESITLPRQPLSHFKAERKSLEEQLRQTHENILKINAEQRDILMAAQVANENNISLSRVRLSTESIADGAVRLLVGWMPEDKVEAVQTFLDSHRIYYELASPTLDDNVPVEIRNGKYSTLFEPILKMYSLPKYNDLDVTPFFAPFFMLFFGLCMGDAGYGALILAACLFLKKRLPEAQRPFATLGIYLGSMTIVCGALTGSIFGIDLTQQSWAFLAPVKDKFISEHNFTLFGYSPMMVISVIIGLIQVLLGMTLAGIKAGMMYGARYAIGKLSWVLVILAAVLYFGLPACGVVLPTVLTYTLAALMGVSVLGIFFYNSPGKNVFMNFGSGVWATYGMATGLLGDLLSYIRLFALGLTGGVLGGVFNSLAIDMTSSMSWAVRWLPMLIILLLGHSINFALCMISSFVHPIRLTFVEFFKNADFEGGGKAYNPFRIKTYKKL